MNKTNILVSVALATSFALVGCSGGSSDGSVDSSVETTLVSGKAIDPELVGATVCLDINLDGTCNEDEPSATTDDAGTYQLEVATSYLNGEYPLIAVNGIDKESQEAFVGTLMADVNSTYQNITPLTTLAYAQIQENMSKTIEEIELAREKLENIVGMTYEEMQVNMITAADEGNTTALKVALTLQKSAEAIAPRDTVEFYKELAQEIDKSEAADTLETTILEMTPLTIKTEIRTLIETILDSTLSDAYALSEEARMKAIELGIDYETMIEMITEESDIPNL